VALVLVAACAPPAAYPSGLSGVVLAGPACPGPARIESPCPDRPAPGVALVFIRDGAQAAGTTTFADGRFRIDLPPGTYTIRGAGNGFPIVRELVVTVPPDRHVDVTVHADTGIR
jgi:carboxypeptidase family protein